MIRFHIHSYVWLPGESVPHTDPYTLLETMRPTMVGTCVTCDKQVTR